MGDNNKDIFNSDDTHETTNDFVNLMSSNSFFPLISKPTRITSSSVTLIDNIFTNIFEFKMVFGILSADLTDHLPIFQITNLEPLRNARIMPRNFCLTNSRNIENFQAKLAAINWSFLELCTCPNECYNNAFLDRFLPPYIHCFPLKKCSPTKRKFTKPWFTSDLLKSCRKKNSLYKQYLFKTNLHSKVVHTKYRNK